MLAALKLRLSNWIFQPRAPESGAILLVQRRVFILPTRYGLLFGLVLMCMLLGAINYTLSLGFILSFLLVALAFNTMFYTFRNLARLSISAARAHPVFAGDTAQFTLNLTNDSPRDRYAIALCRERRPRSDETVEHADVPAGATVPISIRLPTERRGALRPGRVTLYTEYPLGLYHAWSYVNPDMACIVYPRPVPAGERLPLAEAGGSGGTSRGSGRDDFAGLRTYHIGDSPRHVAWKAAARGIGLFTKQFSGEAAPQIWLSWDQLPPRMGMEEKLSWLTRWVLDAHAQHLTYGLRLPGQELALGSGEFQRQRCLEALALFELPA